LGVSRTFLAVSGRAKPATDGRLKTSHFEEARDRHLGFPEVPFPPEACHGESAQNGIGRDHPITLSTRLVPAANCPRASGRSGDGGQARSRPPKPVKTSHGAPRLPDRGRLVKTSHGAPRLGLG